MFIEQGFNPENKFWKYIVGSLVVIVAASVGQMPWMLAIFIKTVVIDKKVFPTQESAMMKALDSNLTLFLLTLSFAIGLGTIFLIIKYLHKQTILSVTTTRPKIDWQRFGFSFTIWTIFTIVITIYSSQLVCSGIITTAITKSIANGTGLKL